MHAPYEVDNKGINYIGNKSLSPIKHVNLSTFSPVGHEELFDKLISSGHYYYLHKIDSAVFSATVEYFRDIGADWVNLPLTTKMISSPGEIYAGKTIDYTTDAMPVTINWFDDKEIFLAESSQFYLEMRLLIDKVERVFSIYNSFRKEEADFTHLAEFQHIEFEGKIKFDENIDTYVGLLDYITKYLINNNHSDLLYYLEEHEIDSLRSSFEFDNIMTMKFVEVMDLLYEHTNEEKYKNHSLKSFGSYEEILATTLVGKHLNIIEFPLEEIPFYHDLSFINEDGKQFAKNSDFILHGYREVVGAGQRITDIEAIKKKAEFFNLPADDYEPYLDMRRRAEYETTCGFGLGWQRYTQWLLKLPFIWDASHIPRGHFQPKP